MSDKTPDENRDTDLRSKRNNGYGKTPADAQQQLDWAHQCRIINDEIVVSKRRTK
jgi:hypothetical protein